MASLLDLALPYQKRFLTAPARRKIWLSARQCGKSWALAFLAVKEAVQAPGGLSLCVSTGARASQELVQKCERMAYALKLSTKGAVTYEARADGIRFRNGSRVLSLPSGNPAGLRGYTARCVLIDECAYIDNAYDVYSALVPTLTRQKDSRLVVASTPAGKSGLFWDLWSREDGWYRQSTTIEEAAKDGLEVDVEELRRSSLDPEVFDMEYMCRFADSFGEFLDPSLVDYVDEVPAPEAAYMGMDVGSSSDRTAVVTLFQSKGVLYVKDIAVMHKASYERQVQALKDLYARYGWQSGYIDQNGIGSALAEWAAKAVTSRLKGFFWTASNKTPCYEALRAAVFDHGLKADRRWKPTLELDFQNVHRLVSEGGRVSFEAGRNRGGHSDVTSALVLALQAARKNPAGLDMPFGWAAPSRLS